MNIDPVINKLFEIVLPELIKKYGDVKLKKVWEHFTDKTLKKYLKRNLKKAYKIKTLMHYESPIDFYDIYQPLQLSYKTKIVNIDKLESLFDLSNYITILGDAGSGKTTFVHHIFLKCIKENYKIPVVISFRNLQKDTTLNKTIFDAISASDEDDKYIEKCLEKGKFLIILDGFDERVDSQFKHHEDEIFNCLFDYSENRYLLTSRPAAGAEHLPAFLNYKLKPFTVKEQLEFIKKQLLASAQADDIDSIKNSITSQPRKYVKDFLKNPLLLLLYIITFKYTNTVPQQRYVFYRRVFNTLFLMHDSLSKPNYKRPLSSRLSQDSFEKIVTRFSYVTFRDAKLIFDIDYYEKAVDIIKNTVDFDFDKYKLLYDLQVNIPIISGDNDIYSFVHISIQEYLCVKYIAKLSMDNSKKKAYQAISSKLSRRPYYQIGNFSKLCVEMDSVNYYQYFYVPALKKLRINIYNKFDINKCVNDEQAQFVIAYHFLNNTIYNINIGIWSTGSNYLAMNYNYSSTLYLLSIKFSNYNRIIDLIYRYIAGSYFRNYYKKSSNKDKSTLIKVILSKRSNIITLINDLIQQVSKEIHGTNLKISQEIESDDDLIEEKKKL